VARPLKLPPTWAPQTWAPQTLAAAGLAALTVVRLVVAAVLPLSPDETYYFVWSRALAPGYLDHPPMVALWIRAGTALADAGFADDGALGIRLLAPLAAALGSWLLWDAGERLLPGRGAGLIAAALLNATLLLGAGAVTMTPDTPLLFFWVCALWALARLHTCGANGVGGAENGGGAEGARAAECGGRAKGSRGAWWLAVGLFAGMAFDSKYTAAFLVLGIGVWLLVAERWWLARPWPWLGLAVGLLVVAPVLWWNAAHGWASFAKQGGRIDEWQPARAARFLGELIAGQLGLVTPLVLVLCIAGLVHACRLVWRQRDSVWTLLVALSLPAVVVFVEHAFADRVQGNWPAIVYPSAVIAAAGLEASRWRRLFYPAAALGLGMTLVVYLQATLAPLPVPIRLDPSALQLAGWPALAARIEAARQQAGASFVAADQYGVASELAYWLPGDVAVVGIEPRWRIFDLPAARLDGQVGILVRSTRRQALSAAGPWADREPLGVVARERDGETVERYILFRVVGGATLDATALPRR
jgi:4-amino-4-deoxy-L-arabinose transferase-like glycosyltransferase